jgi:hypothetical protein
MTTGLASIVDLRFDVLEVDAITTFHGAKCEGLTKATDYCNFIADGANLCAQKHSKKWWSFTRCAYSHADPVGDTDGDVNNTFAHMETFDKTLAECASGLTDYALEDFRKCTYGDEGLALRTESAKKMVGKPVSIIWVEVDGKWIKAPESKTDDRSAWKPQVVKAICDAYQGSEKPTECGKVTMV